MYRRVVAVLVLAACSKTDVANQQPAPAPSPATVPATPTAAPIPQPTPAAHADQQREDQTRAIIKACGAPTRDYEDEQAGTRWRHLVYGGQHVELIYQRFPGWTYIANTDPRDKDEGAVLEEDEVAKRLPCSRGVLRLP